MVFEREKIEAIDNSMDDELQVFEPIIVLFFSFRFARQDKKGLPMKRCVLRAEEVQVGRKEVLRRPS